MVLLLARGWAGSIEVTQYYYQRNHASIVAKTHANVRGLVNVVTDREASKLAGTGLEHINTFI